MGQSNRGNVPIDILYRPHWSYYCVSRVQSEEEYTCITCRRGLAITGVRRAQLITPSALPLIQGPVMEWWWSTPTHLLPTFHARSGSIDVRTL